MVCQVKSSLEQGLDVRVEDEKANTHRNEGSNEDCAGQSIFDVGDLVVVMRVDNIEHLLNGSVDDLDGKYQDYSEEENGYFNAREVKGIRANTQDNGGNQVYPGILLGFYKPNKPAEGVVKAAEKPAVTKCSHRVRVEYGENALRVLLVYAALR